MLNDRGGGGLPSDDNLYRFGRRFRGGNSLSGGGISRGSREAYLTYLLGVRNRLEPSGNFENIRIKG